MAAAYSWPVSLPQIPQANYSESVGVNVSRVSMDVGRAKHRFNSPRADKLNVTYLMTTAQLDIFKQFIESTIRYTSRFYLPHPRRIARLPQSLPLGYTKVDPVHTICIRNSTATNLEKGVLVQYPPNTTRYTPNSGVLVESASTNTTFHSHNLLGASWTGCTRTLAPETWAGSVPFYTAAKILTITSESTQANGFSVLLGSTWSMTVAILAGNKNTCTVGLYGSVNGGAGGFWGEPAACTKEIISGPGTFTLYNASIGGLWHIDNLSATIPTLLRITRTFPSAQSGQFMVYPGRVASITQGDSVKITRIQTEERPTYSSYIPTTTAVATRQADIITAKLPQSIPEQVEVVLSLSQGKAYNITEVAPNYYSVSFEIEVLPL